MSHQNRYELNSIEESEEIASEPFLLKDESPQNGLNRSGSVSSEVDSLISEGYEFKQSPYRWLIIIFFTFNFLGRSIAIVGFTSVAKTLMEIYGINTMHTTLLVIPFNATVLFLLLPYNYISINYGLRIPTYIAVITLIIGAWTRMLVNSSFWYVILGQTIMAIGQPLTLVAPAKIAAIWFGDDQRALATTIGSLAGPVGAVLGFVLPFAFLGDDDAVDTPESRDKVRNYILVQNIVIMVLGVPIAFLVKNKPEIAPSISALQSIYTSPDSTWTSFKKLIRNRDYVLLVFSFSGIFAVYLCFGAVMGPLMAQFHYKVSSNLYYGLSYVIMGVLGSFIHAACLDKHKRYKRQYLFICVTNLVCTFSLCFFIKYQSVGLTTLLVGMFGAAQLPIIGVGYQFATELTYPINENAAIGVMQLVVCFLGICFTFATTQLVEHKYKYLAMYSLAVPGVFSFLIGLFIRENLNKHRMSLMYRDSITRSTLSSAASDLDK